MTSTIDERTRQEELVRERLEQLLAAHDPERTPLKEFLAAQFDLGLAWVGFPEGSGGLGVAPGLQRIVNEALGDKGPAMVAQRNIIGYGMGAPTILEHGTPEQIARYLKPMYTLEEIWCQLFSEPGAGSDLAGLATRAERDGDEWVVNGQKVWTTLAHVAKWGLLVARSDPDVPKHKGLTYFIVDMHSPGVEVRPLRQITGEAEFNEVFLTDVRIPDSQRLGGVGEGWRVALTTLMNERVAIGGGTAPRGSGLVRMMLDAWRRCPERGAARRDELMRLWVEAEVLRLTNIRAAANRAKGSPGPEGSVSKVAFAELNKRITSFCMNLLGPDGMSYGSYEMRRPETASLFEDPHKAFLRTRANSIEGGTTEVMKNILGERVLGLPGEPRVDKDLPWSKIPRN